MNPFAWIKTVAAAGRRLVRHAVETIGLAAEALKPLLASLPAAADDADVPL